jgi:hypothetical protein
MGATGDRRGIDGRQMRITRGVLQGATYAITGTNLPDKTGSVRLGQVNHRRRPDDPFFGFVWSALRSGVGDVVGF